MFYAVRPNVMTSYGPLCRIVLNKFATFGNIRSNFSFGLSGYFRPRSGLNRYMNIWPKVNWLNAVWPNLSFILNNPYRAILMNICCIIQKDGQII